LRGAPSSDFRPHAASVIFLLVGIACTAVLVVTSQLVYNRNENRALQVRAGDGAALMTESMPGIQTALATGGELAQATQANVTSFDVYMSHYLPKGGPAVSFSLWELPPRSRVARIVAYVGQKPFLAQGTTLAQKDLEQALQAPRLLAMWKLEKGPNERMGFAYSPANTYYVVYEENALLGSGRARIGSTPAFAHMHYAIYIGAPRAANLVATNAGSLPLSGRTASVTIPYGKNTFTLVMSSTTSLEGSFDKNLPWLFFWLGLAVSFAGAVLVERLVRRRELAEAMAGRLDEVAAENHRLYSEQRTIADTLQGALLPQELPSSPGVQVDARYLAGVDGVDVGGDWYDVIKVDERSFFFVVGDVSGRGLPAATVMAELRYAIRAFVSEGKSPAEILTALSAMREADTDGLFATVLCGHIDLTSHIMHLASAGHFHPLLIGDGQSRFVEGPVGAPIGVKGREPFQSTHIEIPASGTLLAFTDGLVEKRGEVIDVALARLRTAASRSGEPLGRLLDRLIKEFNGADSEDDTALLGVRWTS
jgi:serine phosphatase RsbU (regulator of sigma subunit)